MYPGADTALLGVLGMRRCADRSRAVVRGGIGWRNGKRQNTRTLRNAAVQLEAWLANDPDVVTELDPIPPEGAARRRGEDVHAICRAELDRRRV